jgi:hypothetical protein
MVETSTLMVETSTVVVDTGTLMVDTSTVVVDAGTLMVDTDATLMHGMDELPCLYCCSRD